MWHVVHCLPCEGLSLHFDIHISHKKNLYLQVRSPGWGRGVSCTLLGVEPVGALVLCVCASDSDQLH